jgi:polyhydroxyalkanoate synthesis regulator phasin
MESAVSSGTLNDADGKAVHQKLLELKPELERLNTEVTSRQAAEAEASSELRTQQLKLDELHDRIEQLDRALEKAGGTAK